MTKNRRAAVQLYSWCREMHRRQPAPLPHCSAASEWPVFLGPVMLKTRRVRKLERRLARASSDMKSYGVLASSFSFSCCSNPSCVACQASAEAPRIRRAISRQVARLLCVTHEPAAPQTLRHPVVNGSGVCSICPASSVAIDGRRPHDDDADLDTNAVHPKKPTRHQMKGQMAKPRLPIHIPRQF